MGFSLKYIKTNKRKKKNNSNIVFCVFLVTMYHFLQEISRYLDRKWCFSQLHAFLFSKTFKSIWGSDVLNFADKTKFECSCRSLPFEKRFFFSISIFLYSVISGLNILTQRMSPVCASVCLCVCLSVCPDKYFPQFPSDFDENALKWS